MQTTSIDNETAGHCPRVTVLLPVYNTQAYIGAAIDSVLAQTYPDFELLIIDDGSTDDTPEAISSFLDDPRLRVITHPDNLGRPHARNHGLDLARGEYIAFVDADDRCAPQRLARQVEYLDTHRNIDGVGSWTAWIDARGQRSAYGIREFPLTPEDIACKMLAECVLEQPSMMVRHAAFADYRYDTSFPVAEDYELWARMIKTCRFANIPEPLTQYRDHPEQSMNVHGESQRMADLVVYGRQVTALGMSHDASDLARHERLIKSASRDSVRERTGAPLDIEYLRWARGWLEALCNGNAQAPIYPEPAFTHMLAARWLFAARKAVRNSSLSLVLTELLKSRLTYFALRHPVRQYAYRKIKRRNKADQRP